MRGIQTNTMIRLGNQEKNSKEVTRTKKLVAAGRGVVTVEMEEQRREEERRGDWMGRGMDQGVTSYNTYQGP